MIFVTVGTQLPFDRLIHGVAQWQAEPPDIEVFAQIGEGGWTPPFPHAENLRGTAFDEALAAADLVVSHAGIGTILTCWSLGKPLIVVPRQHALGEHRNDHQTATVVHMASVLTLSWAPDVENLHLLLSVPWARHIPRKLPDGDRTRISDRVNGLLRPYAENVV